MKNLIMIFCQYFEYIYIVLLTLLHLNFLLKFMYGVFVLWSPLLPMKFRSTRSILYFKEYCKPRGADIYFVGSAPIVQFANYFMSPGNCEKQSHQCQSASSLTHFTIELDKIKRPTTVHFVLIMLMQCCTSQFE